MTAVTVAHHRFRTRVARLLAVGLVGTGLAVAASSAPAAAAVGTISGTITRGTGGAFANAWVVATAFDGGASFSADTDGAGHYTITADPGAYCVSAGTSGNDVALGTYGGATSCLDGATPVVVGSGATVTGIDLTLHGGTITGAVRNVDGSPIADASVGAQQMGGAGSGTAQSAANGTFTLPDLPPGSYCVDVRAANRLAPATSGPPQCRTGGVRVQVNADAVTAPLDLRLAIDPTSGSISGRVTYNGVAVANRFIFAYGIDTDDGNFAATAIDGRYTVNGLTAGTYCLGVELDSGSPIAGEVYQNRDDCETGTLVVVSSGPVTNIDVALDLGGTITGTVTTGAGIAIANASVTIRPSSPKIVSWSGSASTDAGGHYSIVGLPAGSYCVTFMSSTYASESYRDARSCSDATPVVVTRGAATIADARMSLGGTIIGHLTVPPGIDPATLTIIATGADEQSRFVHPASNGDYTVSGLVPGSRCLLVEPAADSDLVAMAIGAPTGGCLGTGSIVVTEGGTTRADATVAQGASISGFVIDQRHRPLVDVSVTADAVGPTASRAPGRAARRGIDGSYRLRGVPAGTWCLHVRVGEDGIGSLVDSDSSTCTNGRLVTVAAGQHVGHIDATPPDAGLVFGTIHLPGKTVITGYTIRFTPVAGGPAIVDDQPLFESSFRGLGWNETVAPGTYCVTASVAGTDLVPRVFADVPACDRGATPVTVTALQVTGGVDVHLLHRSFVALTAPVRLMDTRPGEPTGDGQAAGLGAIVGGTVRELQVAGRGGIPADATSAVLNVTAIGGPVPGFLTVFPCGGTRPTASNVNYTAGQVTPNAVITKLGTGGRVCFFAQTTVDVVVDISGHIPSTDTFTALPQPARLMDTRSGEPTVDGQAAGLGPIVGGTVRELQVAGRGGIPADATSAVLNVTAIGGPVPGFLTVFPCGGTRPTASNLNYTAGQVTPNAVITKLGTGGRVCFFAQTTVDVVVDISGHIPSTDTFTALPQPARLMDTRSGEPTVDGIASGAGAIAGGTVRELVVAGRGGVPANAASVVLNVTAAGAAGPGFLTVFPCGAARPTASSLNYVAAQVTPNAVVTRIGTDGKVCFFAQSTVDVVVDTSGSFLG